MIDVVVIGGGHAGVEAAAAAARSGAETVLLTYSRDDIGMMSCNPAIGGLGKGHMVREVDVFGGMIARAADAAAIHHRMLNASKGAAVRGPRVQADRRRFQAAAQAIVSSTGNLRVVEGEAVNLSVRQGRVAGVVLADGQVLACRAIVLASGTFLGARMFRGDETTTGGRIGERAATALATRLREYGLPMARLKTGTPPRIDGRSIDWSRLEDQPSDRTQWTMSPLTPGQVLPQVACAIARTTRATHEIVRNAADRSPLFSGAISGSGPRYCPSIEDKVVRFGDRDGHQIFLEPEGLDDPIVYPNGLSTSLPADVQHRMLTSIAGLERVRITSPGYAVEYDHLDPRALGADLQLRVLPGLYCAGQINGTTGYEEAAGQGLVAGLNAARAALGRSPIILDRASSYIGVMIDDLTLQGVTEPYRMLTARAEYRLTLRSDNAETRLGSLAISAGCLSPNRIARLERRMAQRTELLTALQMPVTAAVLRDRGCSNVPANERRSGFDWLRQDGVTPADVAPEAAAQAPAAIVEEVAEDGRYAPYLLRQQEEITRMRRHDALALSPDLDFSAIPGLSNEMIERLTAVQPASLAAAGRIRGITPAALSAILLHVQRRAA